MHIALRHACDLDQSTLYEQYKNAMRGHIERIWGWNDEWQRNDFEKSLASCDTQVIEMNSAISGYIQTESRERDLYIRMMILDQNYRSRGIGKTLINRLALKAIESGGKLQLKVFKVNDRAIKFYKSNGCSIASEDSVWYTMERSTRTITRAQPSAPANDRGGSR